MLNKKPLNKAFTLVELMISIGLGMLIVFTALAGFRTAAQTISTSNRLSLENTILRAGYFEAQVQLDYWTNYDDPGLPDDERPLKAASGANSSIGSILNRDYGMKRGLPFTPMQALQSQGVWPKSANLPRPVASSTINGARVNQIMPRNLISNPPPTSANANDAWEADRGWDPTYSWSPHDPRTWIRANLAEKNRQWVTQYDENKTTDPVTGVETIVWKGKGEHPDFPNVYPPIINGRYILFSNTQESPGKLQEFVILPNPNISGPLEKDNTARPDNAEVRVKYENYPTEGIHSWFPNQMQGLINAMGYAALVEYLPPNTLYVWHTNVSNQRTNGGWLNLFGLESNYEFTNDNGNQRTARGIWRNTYPYAYGYLNPRSNNDWRGIAAALKDSPATGSTLRQRFFQRYKADNDAEAGQNKDDMNWFVSHTGFPEALLKNQPEVWPLVDVSVGRFIKSAHHIAVAKITRLSPHTGEVIELSWTGLGTTLRGARQQRLRTTGWARWDNDPGVTNDPHLDTP